MRYVPSPIGLQEILRLYDLPEQLVLVGALYEKALASSEKEIMEAQHSYGGDTLRLLKHVMQPSSIAEHLHDIHIFLLKLGILIRNATRLPELNETQATQWSQEALLATQLSSEATALAPEYAMATSEMSAYLNDALQYYQTRGSSS